MPSFKILGPAIRFDIHAIFPGEDFETIRKKFAKQLREMADDLENDETTTFYAEYRCWLWTNYTYQNKRQKTKAISGHDQIRQWD